MKNIEEYTPISLLTQTLTEPYHLITIVFDNDQDPILFKTQFLDGSSIKLTMAKTKRGGYLLNFNFPNNDSYTLSIEVPSSENELYEKLLTKNLAITCGFQMSDGKIAALPNPYILDNKISLN